MITDGSWVLVDEDGVMVGSPTSIQPTAPAHKFRWSYQDVVPNLDRNMPRRITFSHGSAEGLATWNQGPRNIAIQIYGKDPKDIEIVVIRFNQCFGIEEVNLSPFPSIIESLKVLYGSVTFALNQIFRIHA